MAISTAGCSGMAGSVTRLVWHARCTARSMVSSNAWALSTALACALSVACATGRTNHKSHILPAVEIVAMDAAVNLGGRLLIGPANYKVTPASIRRNLRGPRVVDDDP